MSVENTLREHSVKYVCNVSTPSLTAPIHGKQTMLPQRPTFFELVERYNPNKDCICRKTEV